MHNILFVWELGGHLGHLMRYRSLAVALGQRGFRVSLALRDLSRAHSLFDAREYVLYQAPIWLPAARNAPRPPLSYAEILHHYGYLKEEGVQGMVRAWRALYSAEQPDLVLFDHAPTALLAARGLPFAKAIIGTGFFTPPPVSPMPAFNAASPAPRQRLVAAEQRVLKAVNSVLGDLGQPDLGTLCELFEVDENFMCTVPELDHYHRNTEMTYWGPILGSGNIHPPPRLSGTKPSVFAYLKPQHAATPRILGAMKATDVEAFVYSPDVNSDIAEHFASNTFVFSRKPYDIGATVARSDLVICHGGHDTAAAALLGGKPVLLAPMQAEQAMLATRIEQAGLGITIDYQTTEDEIASHLTRLMGDEGLRLRAAEFAAKYRDFAGSKPLERVVARCEALVNQRRSEN